MTNVIAVDLGASNGRVMLAGLADGRISLEEIHRFPNEGIHTGERCYTDILEIYHEIIKGIRKADFQSKSIKSIGIDSWGVDFGLLDGEDELLGNPYHYRDLQSAGMAEEAEKNWGKGWLFQETGNQDMWYNTVFQLLGIRKRNYEKIKNAKTFLMLPDILTFFLTGEKNLEYTSVSTTQIYSLYKKGWSAGICSEIGISENIFPRILMTGDVKGVLTDKVKREIGIPEGAEIPVTACAQHDSASAAYAVPASGEDYVFINSGTWSIIGMILDQPLVNAGTYNAGLANEGAAYGKIKLVKTIMGMWPIQELRKQWEKRGENTDYSYLLKCAQREKPFSYFINVEDEMFRAPSDMEAAINRYCLKTGQGIMKTAGEFYRAVIESLAFQYRKAVEEFEETTGRKINEIYLLGGSVRDEMFCQYTADATGRTVYAGLVEATALGNALVQLQSLGNIKTVTEKNRIIRNSFDIKLYSPQNYKRWNQEFKRYKYYIENIKD